MIALPGICAGQVSHGFDRSTLVSANWSCEFARREQTGAASGDLFRNEVAITGSYGRRTGAPPGRRARQRVWCEKSPDLGAAADHQTALTR